MAVSYNPSIVRDGLVLNLDAANFKSVLFKVEVLVVAGGGGGGTGGGGGGAGGLLYSSSYSVVPGTAITVTVGNGGTGTSTWGGNGTNGGNSVFGTLTAIGGGAGGHRYSGSTQGTGGSGGGNAGGTSGSGTVIMANGTSGQGFTGGSSIVNGSTQEEPGGGGGGAGGRGADSIIPANTTNAAANSALPGAGGVGLRYNISGTPTYYAGGGGGSNRNGVGASGGLGGGGAGGTSPVAGTNGLGGGGGGTGFSGYGGGGTSAAGGSGAVIVRYYGPQQATGGTITSVGGYTIHTFTTVGSTTFTPNATWSDMTGNGVNATITGSLLFTTTGLGGLTFSTDPTWVTGGYADIPHSASVANIVSFTLSFGIFSNGTQSGNGASVFHKGNESTEGFICEPINNSIRINYGNGSSWFWETISTPLTHNIPAIYDIVYNGTQVKIYKNGVQLSSDNAVIAWDNTNVIRIGRRRGHEQRYLYGTIFFEKFYNRALSAAEIVQNFNALRGRYGI